MEKMIAIYTLQGGAEKNRAWRLAEELLGVPYPFVCSSRTFLDIPVEAYGMTGISDREITVIERMEKEGQIPAGQAEEEKEKQVLTDRAVSEKRKAASGRQERKRKRRRLEMTFYRIRKEIQRKKRQRGTSRRTEIRNMTILSGNVYLYYSWREEFFPAELMLRFYRKCCQENLLIFRAEQLIFLDGWRALAGEDMVSIPAPGTGLSDDPELTVMQEIYSTYNYVTIITEREEAWQAFSEDAYEEYGLSVRCVRDDVRLTFRDKKTLILDMRREGCRCMGNFPAESVYLDMRRMERKSRKIAARCGKIPYVSLHNALDTVLRDGV